MAPRNDQDFWTDEKTAECHRLYIVDGICARVVAQMIGTTRNAIIGKSHRMGWDVGDERCVRRKLARMGRAERRQRDAQMARQRYAARPKPLRPPKPPKPPKLAPTEFVAVGQNGKLPRMDGNVPSDAAPIAFRLRPKNRCNWPIGPVNEPATADSPACGAPALEDCPYCQTHTRQAAATQQPRPVRAPRDRTIITRRAA